MIFPTFKFSYVIFISRCLSFQVTGVPCCRQKGVPEQCIGHCMFSESYESRRNTFRSSREDYCKKYESIWKECELGSGKGRLKLE